MSAHARPCATRPMERVMGADDSDERGMHDTRGGSRLGEWTEVVRMGRNTSMHGTEGPRGGAADGPI